MHRFTGRRRLLVVAALAASALVGTGTALAVSSTSNSGSPFWNDVARRLGVSPAKLHTAMQQALADRLNQLVKQGVLTRAQADAILRHAREHDGPFGAPGWDGQRMGPPLFPRRGMRGHFFAGPPVGPMHPGPFGGVLQAASSYLDVPVATLLADVRAGKTLASVAQAQHKSVAGLEQAMIAAANKQLDAAVKAKRITQAQRDAIAPVVSARLKDFVEHGFRWHHDRDDDDGRPGMGSGGAPTGGAPAVGFQGSPV